MPGERSCPASGCTVEIRMGMLLCYKHWKSLPTGVKWEVSRAWEGFRNGTVAREDYERTAAEAVRRAR